MLYCKIWSKIKELCKGTINYINSTLKFFYVVTYRKVLEWFEDSGYYEQRNEKMKLLFAILSSVEQKRRFFGQKKLVGFNS